jgi:hypothetical protein
VRWWTEIDPMEDNSGGAPQEEVKNSAKVFAPNLTKSDQVNKVLAEGMNEKDEFLYANGGGAEALWNLIDLEAQQKGSPQCSKVGGSNDVARGTKGEIGKQLANSRVPAADSMTSAQKKQGQMVLFDGAHQPADPHVKQSLRPLLQQLSAIKMSASAYRKLFSRETTPINISFNAKMLFFTFKKLTTFSIYCLM